MRVTLLKKNIHVWVLAPYLVTNNPVLDYYYDYTQSIAEYSKAFVSIGCTWQWVQVNMHNIPDIINTILQHTTKHNVALNLCDGDEINGTPGISVIKALQQAGITYTGADAFFYNITTSKIPMKRAFDIADVPNAAWQVLGINTDTTSIFNKIGKTLIVKPAVSGGSMGLSTKNVVETQEELQVAIAKIQQGYQGYDLMVDGIFAEEYIVGREFTTFIVGDANDVNNLFFYNPVERVFNNELQEKEKFLSYDRLWETYDTESEMTNQGYVYQYASPEPDILDRLKTISIKAYLAVQGTGYGRIDIRMCDKTNKLYVLEVNAQNGISEDEDYTSIGAILKATNITFAQLLVQLINNALYKGTTINPNIITL